MKLNSEGGIDLERDELEAVAVELIVQAINDDYGAMQWENVPQLSEDCWQELVTVLGDMGKKLRDAFQRAHPAIDGRYLMEKLQ